MVFCLYFILSFHQEVLCFQAIVIHITYVGREIVSINIVQKKRFLPSEMFRLKIIHVFICLIVYCLL